MKSTRSPVINRSGYSLVEIAISLLIISLLVLTFMSAFSLSAKINAKSKRITDSSFAAHNLMEELVYLSKTMSFNETLDYLQSRFTTIDSSPGVYSYAGDSGGYYFRIEIQDIQGSGLYKVLVLAFEDTNCTQPDASMESLLCWVIEDGEMQ